MINFKQEKIIASLKKIKPKELIYPGVFISFFIVVSIVFFFAVQFISKNINKIFSSEQSNVAQALNLERYKLTAKKLGLTMPTSKENGVAVTEQSATTPIATTTAPSAPDKRALTIIVQNSTTKAGAATILAKALEDGGFIKPKTGNLSTLYATTTLFIKESKSSYATLLLEEIKKVYSAAIATTTPESAAFDATIIIGTR